MTNTQNLGIIIVKLMEEEQKLKEAYSKTKEWESNCYGRVLIWEEAYAASGEDEGIEETLDEVYYDYNKANEAMHEVEKQLEAIEEALEALRQAAETIERLGL